jgi:hypothetical protein
VAKLFRLWGKKRGERRTGSRLVGGLGEALFSGSLFVLGVAGLAGTLADRMWGAGERMPISFGFGFWVIMLVSASLAIIGGIGFVFSVLQVGASRERRAAIARRAERMDILHEAPQQRERFPTVPHDTNLTNSPGTMLAYRLPTSQNSAWRLLASTVFCLFWSGITAVLVALATRQHFTGQPNWLLTLSALAFVTIGAAAVYYFVRQMLEHTGVGPTHVEISAHPLYPGQHYQVFVSQSGHLAVNQLSVNLVCEEVATYHQGTDVRTQRQAIYSEPVFVKEAFRIEPGSAFEQQCELRIPETAMHSFQTTHSAVNWKIVVRTEAVSWPPSERSFPVVVHPLVSAASHA